MTNICTKVTSSIHLHCHFRHYPKEEENHIHLDEKKLIPVEFSTRRIVFNGFTSAKKIQDYPIRGNAVYLDVGRRKLPDTEANEILTKPYSIAFEGTQLTKGLCLFLKRRIESTVLSIKTIGEMYGVDGDLLARQYKQHISGFEEWEKRDTAEEYVLFPENIGAHLSIDETYLSHDELYTIVTNKAFRVQFRGVRDIPFFIFRLAKIFA